MSLDQVLKDVQEKFLYEKPVTVRGIEFTIGLLSYEEDQKVASLPEEDDPMVYMNEIRRQTLAYAVRKINGERIPDIVQVNENESKEKAVFIKEFLGRFPMKITDQLYDAYVDIRDQADQELEKEMKFEWFKTPDERKEERIKMQQEAEEESERIRKEAEEKGRKDAKADVSKEEEEIKFRKVEEPPEDKNKPQK